VEWLKVKALSSSPSTGGKKKTTKNLKDSFAAILIHFPL
jgi:hypothetical protein